MNKDKSMWQEINENAVTEYKKLNISDFDKILNTLHENTARANREFENRLYENMCHKLVPGFYSAGYISDEEYGKWVSDDTGRYLPKMINKK